MFCAPFPSAHTCLRCFLYFSFLIFFEKISFLHGWLLVGCGVTFWQVSTVLLILVRLICWVVGESFLASFSEKIIFFICIFSDFHGFSGYFLIALGSFSLISSV
jgi:hypothetical protein